jgi:hypothetical protein
LAEVLPSTPFSTQIEAVNAAGIVSGYACGGPGGPCDAQNRPYFRAFDDATRGQLAKIVATAANLDVSSPPAQATFEDVPFGGLYYAQVEAMAAAGSLFGYACGGPGEPCDALNRQYFRPFAYVTADRRPESQPRRRSRPSPAASASRAAAKSPS